MDRESCFNVLWSITREAHVSILRDKATYFRTGNSARVCNAIVQWSVYSASSKFYHGRVEWKIRITMNVCSKMERVNCVTLGKPWGRPGLNVGCVIIWTPHICSESRGGTFCCTRFGRGTPKCGVVLVNCYCYALTEGGEESICYSTDSAASCGVC
jgi:hypothetical protein